LAGQGLKPAKSAAREAYEEAGIRGAISAKPIGAFSYDKRLEENGFTVPCEVRVFAMSVRRQLKSWPEAYERDSRWFEPINALSALKDEGLRDLIAVSWRGRLGVLADRARQIGLRVGAALRYGFQFNPWPRQAIW